MGKTYFILLVVVTVLTLLLTIPGFALMAVIFTFGLAIILLIPLPYLCLGLWALLPAALCWRTSARIPALVVGIGGAAAVLIVPPFVAARGLQSDLAGRGEIAAAAIPLPSAPGIEIRRPATPNPNLFAIGKGRAGSLVGNAPCDDLCERLLMGGQVAWVRVVLDNDGIVVSHGKNSTNENVTSRAMLVRGDTASCRAANADITVGSCVLFVPDQGQLPDLIIKIVEGGINWRKDDFIIYRPTGYRTAHVFLGPDESTDEVFHATQLFHAKPNGQIVFNAGSLGSGDAGGGMALGRSRSASEPIDLVAALETLGISVGAARELSPKSPGTESNPFIAPPPDEYDAALVSSLIAVGPSDGETFTHAFAQVVNGWQDRLRWKSGMSAAERRIFCLALTSSAIPNLFWDDQVIKKHSVRCE